jgi:hypothetical protein
VIATIPEDAWTPIKYPKAIWDQDEQRWIFDAEVAEVKYTAFTGKARKYRATARLLVPPLPNTSSVQVGVGFQGAGRDRLTRCSRMAGGERGMMIGRAAETGVLGCSERVRDAASATDERPREGC